MKTVGELKKFLETISDDTKIVYRSRGYYSVLKNDVSFYINKISQENYPKDDVEIDEKYIEICY